MASMKDSTYWVLMALTGGPRHGYALIEEVSRLTGGEIRLKVATLYPTLERLTHEGLIEVDGDEVVAGRRRRSFRLGTQGAAALEGEAARLAREADRARARLRLFRNGSSEAGAECA